MPTVITRGAMSAQGYGFAAKTAAPVYVEDVFSTYIYAGNGTSQTITNNIDLSTKGGMVWLKDRTSAYSHRLFDTVRGAQHYIISNTNYPDSSETDTLNAFTTSGFSVGAGYGNYSGDNFVSWTFRKQPKFFDIVTYTGTGSATTISHNLGSTPGMIIVKRTDATANWAVYHSGMTSASYYMSLNLTAAQASDSTVWNSTAPTSSVFSVGTSSLTNANTGTYVAYLFASDAGGFGLSGTDSVVSCGSYTGNGSASGPTVTLGWEPQWLLIKRASGGTNGWVIFDNMRGLPVGVGDLYLYPNLSNAEDGSTYNGLALQATGFQITNGSDADINASGATYIYLAIRRGPMKTPTSGTSVFSPITSNNAAGTYQTTNFPVDMQLQGGRNSTAVYQISDRLRGIISTNTDATSKQFYGINTTDAESDNYCARGWDNTGFRTTLNSASASWLYLNFQRAPGFFDVVCYTGTGSATTINHNLGVVPELIVVKRRDNTGAWPVYSSQLTSNVYYAILNTTAAQASGSTYWNSTTPTSSVFSIGTAADVNTSAGTYVAYLFATLTGVSKVGSYTGTGSAQNINCGFAAGARFVMIKRTDSTGGWYIFDSARGINPSGTDDPYFLWNAVGEVTGTDYLGTYSSGFALTSTAPAAMNVSGGTFIYLAIA